MECGHSPLLPVGGETAARAVVEEHGDAHVEIIARSVFILIRPPLALVKQARADAQILINRIERFDFPC